MVGSLNRVTLIGNVGQEPEFHSMSNGKRLCNLSIATTESWRDKESGERRDKTEWHRIVIYNENLVDIVKKYVTKGSKLMLEGTLQTRKWQDKNGQDRYTTEIVLQAYSSNLILLDRRNDGNTQNNPSQANNQYNNNSNSNNDNFGKTTGMFNDDDNEDIIPDDIDDEIPF